MPTTTEKELARIAEGLREPTPRRDTPRAGTPERLPLMARAVLLIGSSGGDASRPRVVRRAFPIRAYVGPNGGGKTLAMVHDILPSLDRGRRVLSSVPILDGEGRPHPLWEPFTDLDQLLDIEHADVLMDEIVGIANSRTAQSLPAPIQNVLVQLRKRDATLSWSAPSWPRADKIVREVTQLVVECRGYFPGRAQRDEGGEIRLWQPNRVFKFRAFDTIEFDEWTAGKRDSLKPVRGASEWFKGPGSRAFGSYNTLDAVSMVTWTDADGLCPHCGKRKRIEYCPGHHDLAA